MAALLSPATGIIDSHNLMVTMLGEAESKNTIVSYGSKVVGGKASLDCDCPELQIQSEDGDVLTLQCSVIINASGIHASDVAHRISGIDPRKIPKTYLSKGNYFALSGKSPAARLVYPIPQPGGLGVHLTIDLAGRARFGPDVEETEKLNYDVNPQRAEKFYSQVRKFFPGLRDGSLTPDYAGIRPRLTTATGGFRDFLVDTNHGGRLINLFGIESPGLTSAPALARYVSRFVR